MFGGLKLQTFSIFLPDILKPPGISDFGKIIFADIQKMPLCLNSVQFRDIPK